MTLTNVLGVELVCWVLMVFYVGGTLLLLTWCYLRVGVAMVRLCDWMNVAWDGIVEDSFDPDCGDRKVAILFAALWPVFSVFAVIAGAITSVMLLCRLARRSSTLRALGHAVFVSPFEPRRAPPTARVEEREP